MCPRPRSTGGVVGWGEEGDTYETQLHDFEEELDRFWANLHGPDEHLRQQVHDLLCTHLKSPRTQVAAFADGRLEIQHEDGASRSIAPPSTFTPSGG